LEKRLEQQDSAVKKAKNIKNNRKKTAMMRKRRGNANIAE
jgi:hypothetical protein